MNDGMLSELDEFVANRLKIRELQNRNYDIQERLLALGENRLVGSSNSHFVQVIVKTQYQFSQTVQSLELACEVLKEQRNALRAAEISNGVAKELGESRTCQVRRIKSS